ncbi:MAG TPA: DNA recombination protein RmuC [Saprospiraceae bacterium]|nr:DNA recombination protein RmuC [Saprospiraceae bacterium]
MNDPLLTAFLFLLLGLVIGVIATWLVARLRFRSLFLSREDVAAQFVERYQYEHLQTDLDILKEDLKEKEGEIRELAGLISSKSQTILHLDDKLRNQKDEIIALQQQSRQEFENIANKLLEEKSKRFTATNQHELQGLLKPLREKIQSFEQGIERRFIEETRDRISLKKEIEQLKELNTQLSQDANNLADALKGSNKTQGDWGELQLELLLQKAGLQKDIHYQAQNSYRDQNGKLKRPDFIINLPEDKQLIIDAKVSLTAYEKFCSGETEQDRSLALKGHLDSIRRHVKDLGKKNYQQLYQINTPDYLLLFIPIDAAFALAVQEDHQLFTDALDRNIVMVTPSTLLATMRTVSYIWKQEKQKKSVIEIARQSGLLYDKFCSFVEDLQTIGQKLDMAQGAYDKAMRKLHSSKRKGDTLVARAERIKSLGAEASKSLPKDLLE